jgi:hypothetical protein
MRLAPESYGVEYSFYTRDRFIRSIHHANAKTTDRVRQEMQAAKKIILNPKTIIK